jgi:hypothetical protein
MAVAHIAPSASNGSGPSAAARANPDTGLDGRFAARTPTIPKERASARISSRVKGSGPRDTRPRCESVAESMSSDLPRSPPVTA